MKQQNKKIILAITGASGALYAKRLIEALVAADVEVLLIVSTWGKRLLHDELGMEGVDLETLAGRADHGITLLPYKDVAHGGLRQFQNRRHGGDPVLQQQARRVRTWLGR